MSEYLSSPDRLLAQAQEQVRRLADLQAGVETITGRARSASGKVGATTGAGGVLEDLQLDPVAMLLSPEELAAEVVSAVSAAQADAAAQAADALAPLRSGPPSSDDARFDQGLARLDGLLDDLDRVARRRT